MWRNAVERHTSVSQPQFWPIALSVHCNYIVPALECEIGCGYTLKQIHRQRVGSGRGLWLGWGHPVALIATHSKVCNRWCHARPKEWALILRCRLRDALVSWMQGLQNSVTEGMRNYNLVAVKNHTVKAWEIVSECEEMVCVLRPVIASVGWSLLRRI